MYRQCYVISKKYVCRILISVAVNVSALLLSAPFTILLLILHVFHFIFKWIILIVHSCSKNSEYFGIGTKILKGVDCGWLEERWQESVLQAVLVFDSKINVNRIQELITSRVIPLYPRLTYKIRPLPFTAGSVHCWLPDDKYDINRHVFTDHVNLSNDQLQIYVSKLVTTKLPDDKPPWELRIVSQSVDCSSTDTIIILRVHQCLADGMTLIKILCTKLADTRASYTALKSHFKFSYYLRLMQAFCIGPALIIYKVMANYKKSTKMNSRSEPDDAKCSINWSTNISMCKIERIKQVTRSSYNCVFLSAITGGLRYVLQSSGIKHPPDLKIALPFVTGKNQKFIPVSTFIPVSMEGAIPRLWHTKHQLKSLSSSHDLMITSFVIYGLMPLCPSFYIPVLQKILHKSANVQFTSIIGPTTRLVIDGSPLKTIYPLLSCQTDLGISTAISMYVDQIFITVMTHTSLENIGKMLLNFIEEQFDRMYSLLVNRTIPEDLNENYFQNQFPDISELPIRELKSRMQTIQHELQRLSEMISYNDDDVKRFSHFKSEFNHIFKELRRRKSIKIRKSSTLTQTMENFSSICSSKKNLVAVLYPFKSEICKEIDNKQAQLKQSTIEESVQMMFNKKYTSTVWKSKNFFKECHYTNANKYIYLTLVNENSNLCNQNNNTLCNIMETKNCFNKNYSFSSTKNIRSQRLFYELSQNEQII